MNIKYARRTNLLYISVAGDQFLAASLTMNYSVVVTYVWQGEGDIYPRQATAGFPWRLAYLIFNIFSVSWPNISLMMRYATEDKLFLRYHLQCYFNYVKVMI